MKNVLNIKIDDKFKFKFKKDFNKILNVFWKEFDFKDKISVDLLITNNKNIKIINNDSRGINEITDILSFPFDNFIDCKIFKHRPMGEIIISYEKIISQAEEFGHSIRREFCYMFSHGLVHLNGFDHKKNKEKEIEFNSYVNNIINILNISR